MEDEMRLRVLFYRSSAGNEPVRDWLKALPPQERKIIGDDLKTAKTPVSDLQLARQRLQSLRG